MTPLPPGDRLRLAEHQGVGASTQTGAVHAAAAAPLRPYQLGPGSAIHPGDDLWDALAVATREALAVVRRATPADVVAVGLCGIRFCRALLEPTAAWPSRC